ncbi:Cadherin_repeat domain containing protein [Candidatus Nanopelagicaceae bacterium]
MNLQKLKNSFVSVVLLAGIFSSVHTPVAQALTVGSNQCVQTVDSSAGVSVYQDTGFCYVAFKNATSYTWSPPTALREIDLLVVAGGGGGGSRHAGGGGAGGVINLTSVGINGTDINLSVGSGGAGGVEASAGGNTGTNGNNSQASGGGLTTRIAIGGGGGGYGAGTNSGGSGAGGGSSGAGGANTAGQGFPGSAGITDGANYWVGGGGGGAGETGTASATSKAGSGGRGTSISWLTANASSGVGVGVESSQQFFVGGGGGGGSDRAGIAGGNAGLGGGGAGSTGTASAGNATTNTGGGGGGSGISGVGTGSLKGGDGARGVILIRYLIPVAQFDASNYTAGSTTWSNTIAGGTAGTTATGGMTKTASGPTGVVFAGKESSNSDQVSSSIGSTSSIDTVTVEMWMKLKDSGSAQNAAGSMLFSWGAGGYNVYHYQNQLGFNNFASQLYGVDSTSYNGNWTHFVFVMTDTGDWSSQKIYVNGALQASTCRVTPANCTSSQARTFQSNGDFLMMNNANAANTWNAKVDLGQVKIYNRELSSTQISAHYASTSASYGEADSTAPTFSNGATFTFVENTIASTVAATISVNESSTISIVSGVDSALFGISAVDTVTGQVKFLASPDFENALDVGANNVYNITVRATDTLGNSGDQSVSITVTNANESSTIGAPSLSAAASKGSVVTISVTTNAAGKVRFFVSGKRIAGCLARSTAGSYPSFSATCSWKPPVTGSQILTARITPTNSSFTTATSAATSVWVVKRSNSR